MQRAGAVQGNAPCTGSSAALLPSLSSGSHSPGVAGWGQDRRGLGSRGDGSAQQLCAWSGRAARAPLWSRLGPSSPQGAPGELQGSVPSLLHAAPTSVLQLPRAWVGSAVRLAR